MTRERISYAPVETALGRLWIAGRGGTVVGLSLDSGGGAAALGSRAARRDPEAEWVEDPGTLADAIDQLAAYARGERREFDLELAPAGTPFEQRVWSKLRAIPYGETRTYGELAASLGTPGASRAVGRANGSNPIPILIPCHRCVAADGLGGFTGGLRHKVRLIEHERAHADTGQGLLDFPSDL